MQVNIALTTDRIVAYGNAIKLGLSISINDYLCGTTPPVDIDSIADVGHFVDIPVLRITPERITAAVIPEKIFRLGAADQRKR
jgi:hypothetical protein